MLVRRCREVSLSRSLRLLHPRFALYVVPRGAGLCMVGATMIDRASRSPVSARSLMELMGAAYALHPAFGEDGVVVIVVDARPAFPINLTRNWRNGANRFVTVLFTTRLTLAAQSA